MLKTFGELTLEGASLRRPKPLLLLTYLAFEGPVQRRKIAELFFGGLKDPHDSLTTALKYLKQDPASALEFRSEVVTTKVECDAKAFLDDLAQGDFVAAVNRYGGPFLLPLELALGEELEEWVYGTREFLARGARGALLQLAHREASWGRLTQAASQAERAYTLAGAPELEPEEMEAIYTLLLRGGSPRAVDLKREASEVGVTLAVPLESHGNVLETAAGAAARHNLTGRGTAFIGRGLELAEIAKLLALDECRLLSLTGPGGIGKTRLALQAALHAHEENAFPDGVHFVLLESVGSPDLVPTRIAGALQLDLQGQTDLLSAVVDAIGNGSTLLVLDNFEQLLEGAPLISELLRRCANLKVIVTSRERLNLEEEWLLPVAGLSFVRAGPVENPTSYDAVQLFVQRAKRVALNFSLTPENAPHVLEICRSVGGSPLGLELSAAWIRIFSPEEIAQEIRKDLDFLASDSRSSAARHKSVRAAFEHSWRLLKPTEQEVLSGLSVFQEGFSRDAASQVLGATIPVLASLVDKSLLRVARNGRYDRHPLVYQYAQEKLEEGVRRRLHHRHAAFYLALAETFDGKLQKTRDPQDLGVLEQEHANLRVALRWSLVHDGTTALRLGGALGRFWEMRGYLSEGRRWLEEALERHPDILGAVRAKALTVLGRLTLLQGEVPRAQSLFEEGLGLWRRVGDALGTADALNRLGLVAMEREAYARAGTYYSESLDLYRTLGDKDGTAIVLNNFGELARCQGDFRGASEFYEASLALPVDTGNIRRRALVLGNLGFVTLHLGDAKKAETLLKESLKLKYKLQDEIGLSYCFAGLAGVSCELEEFERATVLLGVVEALLERTRHQLDLADRHDAERALVATRAQLVPDIFSTAWEKGREMSLEQAACYALGQDVHPPLCNDAGFNTVA